MTIILTEEQAAEALKKAVPGISKAQIETAVEQMAAASGAYKPVDIYNWFGPDVSTMCKEICTMGEAAARGIRVYAFIDADKDIGVPVSEDPVEAIVAPCKAAARAA